ncbi:hypothetical protein K530_15099 [Streptomyces noursei CCRC 11814]|nr:hypothetical protein K530_15099 [Streptomyces noursei CCRC 11814]
MTVAMEGTFTELRGRLSEVGRVALFGHSLGAVLAYEMSRRIQAWSPDKLVHLFVSGSPGPRKGRAQRTADLTDDEFLARVEELAGYRHPVFDIPEMREMLLPSLRADVRMHEEYRQTDTSPISVPVTAIRGTSDALVSRAEMEEWGAVTTEKFEAVELPGGHMYLADAPPHPLDLIEAVLGQ